MERTLAIIKPDAVAAKHAGNIIDIIENNELLLEVSSLIDVQDIKQDITNLKLIESEIFNLYERDDEREQIKQLVS